MVEKKFYLHSKRQLQRVGLRAQIVSFLIENGIEKGNAVNDEDDRGKVAVAICYESKPSDAKLEIEEMLAIRDRLVSYLNTLSEADPECYGQIPGDITASELLELNNPHAVATVDLQKLSASLMLEQTSKGVGAMLSLGKTMKEEFGLLKSELAPLKSIQEILERMSSGSK